MKEMFQLLGEVYREDKKEFFGSIAFMIGWVCLVYFLFWFRAMFAYDM
jgi:hypothetical protein